MSDSAPGTQADSPLPTPARATMSCTKLVTAPQAMVVSDQKASAPAMMRVRIPRSSQRAIGKPTST
jgi:hypothetical protein